MASMWQDRDKIADRPIGKALLSLAVPAVLSTFFTVIFEVIDMFWIGKLGAVSIAALSASSFFIWMIRGLGLTVATGTIALVARRTGEKNEKALLETIYDAIGSAFLFSLIIMVVFFPVALFIFRQLRIEAAVAEHSVEFCIVFLGGVIFVYLMTTLEYIIRGVGDTRSPMIIMGGSLLLNALLDPVFIFVLDMGFTGAAYATIVSQAVGAVLMALIMLKKIPALRQKTNRETAGTTPGHFFRRFLTIIKIGGPIGVSDAGFSFIYLLLSGIISIFGKEPLAAVGIAHRLEALPFFICLGFSMAVSPMVGQYLGAGEPEKARESVYLSLKITGAVNLLISIVYFVYAPSLFRIFTPDPLIIAHGVDYLRIIAVFEVFLAFEVVLGGAFSGAGDTQPPFWVILPVTALRVPLSYVLAVTLGLNVIAVWAAISVTTFLKGSLLLYLFNKGKWATRRID